MSNQIISNTQLRAEHVLSATETAGFALGQPEAAASNTGTLVPSIDMESAQDVDIDTETTGAGSTTAVVCRYFSHFGASYWIGATITITEPGHAAVGQSRTVTDWVQSTYTFTVSSAFAGTIGAGVAFTLALPAETRAFGLEIAVAGAPGTAEYKWTHNGTTWLGRQTVTTADWFDDRAMYTTSSEAAKLLEGFHGEWFLFCGDGSGNLGYLKSLDHGVTWSAFTSIGTFSSTIDGAWKQQTTGRLVVSVDKLNRYYSEDDGATWTFFTDNKYINAACERACSNDWAYGIFGGPSIEGGAKLDAYNGYDFAGYYSLIEGGGVITGTGVCEHDDGSLARLFLRPLTSPTRQDVINGYGTAWPAVVKTVLTDATYDYKMAVPVPDLKNGRVIVLATKTTASGYDKIVASLTTDDGETFGSEYDIKVIASRDLLLLDAKLMDGGLLVCVYRNDQDGTICFCYRGCPTTFTGSNGVVARMASQKQILACGLELFWGSGTGVVGDLWATESDSEFSAANVLLPAPQECWRSITDNSDMSITFDMQLGSGLPNRLFADGAAFFGCNVRTLSYQMNATDSWSSPSVSATITFDLHGSDLTVDSASGNTIYDAALVALFCNHALKGKYIRVLSGTDSGKSYKILDNVAGHVLLDAASHSIAAGNTYRPFGPQRHATFTGGLYRFVRVLIPAQETAEGYYQIGTMVAGRVVTLSQGWGVGFGRKRIYSINVDRTLGGSPITLAEATPKYVWQLGWSGVAEALDEVTAVMDDIRAGHFALIPDSAGSEIYLVVMTSDIEQSHKARDKFNFSLQLEEVV